MKQTYTSANTSINSSKLPAVYSKVDFDAMATCFGLYVLDYGCGKFNNGKVYIESMGGEWFGYDPYNRTQEENKEALTIIPSCILCSNVLNVIAEEDIIQQIVDDITGTELPYFFTIYEGNKSGMGGQSKDDCYQRNEATKAYLRFFPATATIRKGVITNAPDFVL